MAFLAQVGLGVGGLGRSGGDYRWRLARKPAPRDDRDLGAKPASCHGAVIRSAQISRVCGTGSDTRTGAGARCLSGSGPRPIQGQILDRRAFRQSAGERERRCFFVRARRRGSRHVRASLRGGWGSRAQSSACAPYARHFRRKGGSPVRPGQGSTPRGQGFRTAERSAGHFQRPIGGSGSVGGRDEGLEGGDHGEGSPGGEAVEH